MQKNSFLNHGLSLLVVRSNNIERMAAFYSAIGLDLERHSHPPCGDHFSSRGYKCVFEICHATNSHPETAQLTIGFNVTLLTEAIEAAIANGGTLIRPPKLTEWGRVATVSDPDGNRVVLTESQ